MIHHASVSIAWLEDRIVTDPSPYWLAEDGPDLTLADQQAILREWRSQGYTYVPNCDNIRKDGRCAGHKRKE